MGLFGGGNSSSSTSTTNNQYDQRSIADAGGGIAGSGNQWDASVSTMDSGNTTWNSDSSNRSSNTSNWTQQDSGNTTWNSDSRNLSTTSWNSDSRQTWDWKQDSSNSGNTNWDASNRSTNNWSQQDSSTTTWNSDSSNRSTTNWDASDRSTTTWNQTTHNTDGRAFEFARDVNMAQTDAAKLIALRGIDTARAANETATAAAIRAQENAVGAVTAGNSAAFDFARSNAAQAFKSSTDAMGWAGEKFDSLTALASDVIKTANRQTDTAASTARAAYDSAASNTNGNKTLMLVALAAVGIIGAAVFYKKAA